MKDLLPRLALVAIGVLATPICGSAQQLPPGFEEGLFEIVVPSVGSVTTSVLVDESQSLYLPLPAVLGLVGYEVLVGEPGQLVWRAAAAAPEHRLTFDPPRYIPPALADTMWFGGRALMMYAGDVFLRTDAVARLLAAEVAPDWSTLRVMLSGPGPYAFPAQARARIEARRERLSMRGGADRIPAVPYDPRTGGAVFDWSVSSYRPDGNTAFRGALGAAVWGGDLLLGGSGTTGDRATGTADYSYRRIFPERERINQLLIGQVLTQDLAPRSILGVVVSNIPQQRDAQFAEVPVRPEMPDGWEFEVYQSGQLLGFSGAGSDEAVSVPVRYGQTPLEVRMISPAGEEVTLPYRYMVPLTHLPPNRLEYSAGAGTCPAGRCDALGYGEVRRGFGRRLTLGGGLQAFTDEGEFHLRPSILGSFLPNRHWSMDFEARAAEFIRASIDRFGDEGGHARLAASLHEPAFGQPTFFPGSNARWQIESRVGLPFLHITGRADGTAGEGFQRTRLGIGGSLPRGYGEASIETGAFGPDALAGRATTILPERWWILDRPVSMSGSFRTTRQGVRLLELSAAARPGIGNYVSAAVQWNAEQELRLSLTFRKILEAARVDMNATRRAGTSTLAATAGGSVALEGERRIVLTDRNLQGRAGVVGRVFYDRNGNRTFDPGDEPAPDVSVLVGGVRVRTGDSGFYSAWNITPYEITAVAVDTLSGIDPRYTVLAGGTLLRPVPHVPNRVDFPLAETRELLGRVVTAGGRGIGGVTVELTHPASGRHETTRTFSDGTYYVSRVRPGVWIVGIADASLAALNAEADPHERRVEIDLQDPSPLVELQPFVLRTPGDEGR